MKQDTQQIWQHNRIIIAISIVILLMALLFRQQLYGVLGEQNYISIHLIIELFIITIAFMIAIQTWMIFPHSLSSYRLWLGALFFAVGLLEIAHTLTFTGMPFFIAESSEYRTAWFNLVARYTEVIAILAIVISNDRLVASRRRWYAYSVALIYFGMWFLAIFSSVPLLPELVDNGVGTTATKNILEYGAIVIRFVIIAIVFVRFRLSDVFSVMLIISFVYLMMSDYYFTTYKTMYDINNFVGHLFKLAGFYFLQRAVFHTAVEEPFIKQKAAEQQLLQNEKFLQTITTNMGEGLIVLNKAGELTYMNIEAERILKWSQKELLGKNVHDYIHRKGNGSLCPKEECPNMKSIKYGRHYRIREDYFVQKQGTLFPVSYVVTPIFENEEVTGAIMVFRDISQQKIDQEKIHNMAFYDELTKLPNIRFLKEKLLEMINRKERIVIIILDIDRFKNINEALGHPFGDLILQEVASRLQNINSKLVARLTGDEYALVITDVMETSDIHELAEQIQAEMKEPLRAQDLFLNVSLSAGVAFYPEHGTNVDELIQRANLALVEAQQKRNNFQIYDPSQDGIALERLVLENDLHHALEKGELHVVYQPQINIQTGAIIGVEALIRWKHPTQGWISPEEFIPIAEDNGLVVPIGEWVLRTACSQMKRWHEQGLSNLFVGVNLSIRQFYQQNLVSMIKEILEDTNLSPQYLELEITESMMMNVEHSTETLQALKKIGIHVSIDDFGTGYSSLSYLRRLQVDRLKIDQSFVGDLQSDESDSTIISTIVSMARHLNLEVIAEGVETLKQTTILLNQRCYQAQGFLFSEPLTGEDFMSEYNQLQQHVKEIVGGTQVEFDWNI